MASIIKLTRPSHWIKNLFILLPLFFGHQLANTALLYNAILAFFAFCFTASSIYCLNDIIDVEDDRRHPIKCARPIASGKISIMTGYVIMFFMLALGIGAAMMIPQETFRYNTVAAIIGYWLMEIAYCMRLKRYAIIDVCILSIGFIFRILVGGVATGIILSHWLVMMTFLLTLFLGFAKRRDDVLRYERTGIAPRKNTSRYNITFINEAITITGGVMLVCYIMYTVSPEVTSNFNTQYLYLTSGYVIVGLLRYIQLAVVDEKSGDPTKVMLHDRMIQCIVAAWFITFFLIIYCN
ncbi:MAG: decaprenyl-phosphate phosphoribosyltransferase [Prevotella sp.]|nr:decaprenyl-phosphate phosphoribosyltransferase [Candidatus Prevotella equi]